MLDSENSNHFGSNDKEKRKKTVNMVSMFQMPGNPKYIEKIKKLEIDLKKKQKEDELNKLKKTKSYDTQKDEILKIRNSNIIHKEKEQKEQKNDDKYMLLKRSSKIKNII